jgi:hypothetical protein
MKTPCLCPDFDKPVYIVEVLVGGGKPVYTKELLDVDKRLWNNVSLKPTLKYHMV